MPQTNHAQEQNGSRSLGTDCNRKGHRRSYQKRGTFNGDGPHTREIVMTSPMVRLGTSTPPQRKQKKAVI